MLSQRASRKQLHRLPAQTARWIEIRPSGREAMPTLTIAVTVSLLPVASEKSDDEVEEIMPPSSASDDNDTGSKVRHALQRFLLDLHVQNSAMPVQYPTID